MKSFRTKIYLLKEKKLVKFHQDNSIYFYQSIEIRELIEDNYGKANSYLGFGQMYLGKKNYEKAEEYVLQSLEISKANDIKLVEREGVAALVDLAEARGDYKEANTLL